jgi:ABC-2 type transport system ATP-binding protein
MIEVRELRKDYGPTKALQGISFDVASGEVIGFLGPNGAGKSTTMKILTGFLLPTSGSARVGGLDVVADSLEVRRRIGYLPESTPLYTEMRVDDYLRFAARIRGVPARQTRAAILRVIELCGLERVVGKNIIELSKGYKQRVGLAQAMIHEPDVLILDEPTSGLDPNQIVEVRRLITRLGQDHTVILSTHYLQEVEQSCSRIIIVSLGKIVADDTRDNLVATLPAGRLLVRLRGSTEEIAKALAEALPEVRPQRQSGNGEECAFTLEGGEDGSVEAAVTKLAVGRGWKLLELTRRRATLEDVFRARTLAASKEAGHA